MKRAYCELHVNRIGKRHPFLLFVHCKLLSVEGPSPYVCGDLKGQVRPYADT
jgi:hypothetical protein